MARNDIERLYRLHTSSEHLLLILGVGRSSGQVKVGTLPQHQEKIFDAAVQYQALFTPDRDNTICDGLFFDCLSATSPLPTGPNDLEEYAHSLEVSFYKFVTDLQSDRKRRIFQ